MTGESAGADSLAQSAGADFGSGGLRATDRQDGAMSREPAAQPTAPYLEAITAYGFRGSLRFHVPGHKGVEGADPGLRTALGDRESEEHTSELQSHVNLVCRLLLEKKKKQ